MKKLFQIKYNENERIFGLDLLRSLAILLVLFEHGENIVRNNFPSFPRLRFMDGVELFFVLSGFLIGTILIKLFEKEGFGKDILFQFWKRRWFRTLPNYYLIVLFILLYFYFVTDSFDDFSWKYLLFIQNFSSPHPHFLGVAWSLAIEEWFYLLFPSVIVSLHFVMPKIKVKTIFVITIILFLFFPLLVRIIKTIDFTDNSFHFWDYNYRKIVITRLDSIVFGVLGAFINYYYAVLFNKYEYLKFIIGITLIIVAQKFLYSGFTLFTFYFDVLAIGILFLFPMLISIQKVPKLISVPITYISIISYSLYLVHSSIILDPITSFFKPFTDFEAIMFYIIYFVLSFLISIFMYKIYEKPIMNFREKK